MIKSFLIFSLKRFIVACGIVLVTLFIPPLHQDIQFIGWVVVGPLQTNYTMPSTYGPEDFSYCLPEPITDFYGRPLPFWHTVQGCGGAEDVTKSYNPLNFLINVGVGYLILTAIFYSKSKLFSKRHV